MVLTITYIHIYLASNFQMYKIIKNKNVINITILVYKHNLHLTNTNIDVRQ